MVWVATAQIQTHKTAVSVAHSISGTWPRGKLRVKEQHTLRSEQMEKGRPPYCALTYLLHPG